MSEIVNSVSELESTETLLWSQTGVTATTDYNAVNINIGSYRKLRIKFFSTTSLYGGEITQLTERIVNIADVQSFVGNNTYFEFSEYFERPDSNGYTFYIPKNNTSQIIKATIWRWGTASDRSISLYLYGIK